MVDGDILARFKQIDELPTLPIIIERLRAAIEDPESDAARIGAIIEDDPAIAVRVLKVVNSGLYCSGDHIHDLQRAVARIGLREIGNIALTTAILDVIRFRPHGNFDRKMLWKHSVCTGIAANVIKEECVGFLKKTYSKDLLHLVGVIHDIGKVIYESFFHNEFMDILRMSRESGQPLYKVERGAAGVDHAEMGAWMVKKWHFPDEFIQVVRWHHEPDKADKDYRELTMLCHAANYLCNFERLGDGGDVPASQIDAYTWMELGVPIDNLHLIRDKVVEEARHSEVLLAL